MKPKIMLVDDEFLVRLGIKSLIDWEEQGFVYAGDAPDGEAALALMEGNVPDILLTDILMPNMNGLELIEAVRKRYPATRIIVLSSHDEYEYVRQAMKLGVDDYILKASLKPDELLQLLHDTARKISAVRLEPGLRELQDDAGWQDNDLRAWLERQLGEPFDEESAPDPLELGTDNILIRLRVGSSGRIAGDRRLERQTVINLLEPERSSGLRGFAIPLKEDELVLLLSMEERKASEPDRLKQLCEEWIRRAKRYVGVSLTAGISRPFQGKADIRKAYFEAGEALRRGSFYEGKEKAYAFSGPAEEGGAMILPETEEQALKRALEEEDAESLEQGLQGFFDRMLAARVTVERSVQLFLRLFHLIEAKWKPVLGDWFAELESEGPLYKQIVAFEELEEARRWFGRLLEDGLQRLRSRRPEPMHDDIRELVRYMKANYTQELTLRQAAERVNMNESYLSTLFKKETGLGFIEYLNQLRMDKAAQLLAETNMPSYLIAERVGYENINYFGRLFKKTMGLSPQQYRVKHQS